MSQMGQRRSFRAVWGNSAVPRERKSRTDQGRPGTCRTRKSAAFRGMSPFPPKGEIEIGKRAGVEKQEMAARRSTHDAAKTSNRLLLRPSRHCDLAFSSDAGLIGMPSGTSFLCRKPLMSPSFVRCE